MTSLLVITYANEATCSIPVEDEEQVKTQLRPEPTHLVFGKVIFPVFDDNPIVAVNVFTDSEKISEENNN